MSNYFKVPGDLNKESNGNNFFHKPDDLNNKTVSSAEEINKFISEVATGKRSEGLTVGGATMFVSFDRLKEMVKKPFLYQNEEIVILNYCDGVGDDGTEVEIYLNNGKVLNFSIFDLSSKLNRFRPITNTVVVLANERLNKVSSVNPTILNELRDMVLQQIKDVKEDPGKVNQAKQVFQGVNTVINLAKTEIEYRKYLDSIDSK